MLSKEEIEKAKKKLNKPKKYNIIEIIRVFKRNGIENYCVADNKTIQTLLQYIQELEISNKELDEENYRLEKIEFERDKANKIIDEMASYISNLDVDEDICNKVKISPCADETSVPASYCIECIKQYFEKKVESKNE